MKLSKIFVLALLTVLLVACCSGLAMGAVFDNCADALSDMGLFSGTDQGYELDRIPTRAEAAAMLVRLLGAEAEAMEANYEHPFSDLKGWEAPYVGYMFEKGLTTGVTETTFEPGQPCSGQMFCTFILRALGYESGAEADFTYEGAEDFSYKLGISDFVNMSLGGDFLRDNVVGLAYTALAAPLKADAEGNAPILLQSLVDQGAVDAEKAAPYLEQFATYAAMQKALATLDYDNLGQMLNFDMDYAVGMNDGETTAAMAATIASQIKVSGSLADKDLAVAMENLLTLTMDGIEDSEPIDETLQLNIYYKDGVGYLYANHGEMGVQKIKFDQAAVTEMAMDQMGILDDDPEYLGMMEHLSEIATSKMFFEPDDPYSGHYGIAMMGKIAVATAGGKTTYTLDMTNLSGMIDTMTKQISAIMMPEDQAGLLEGLTIDIKVLKADYVVDAKGMLESFTVYMEMDQTIEDQVVSLKMTATSAIVDRGAGVKVELPADAAEYVDLFVLLEQLSQMMEEAPVEEVPVEEVPVEEAPVEEAPVETPAA